MRKIIRFFVLLFVTNIIAKGIFLVLKTTDNFWFFAIWFVLTALYLLIKKVSSVSTGLQIMADRVSGK